MKINQLSWWWTLTVSASSLCNQQIHSRSIHPFVAPFCNQCDWNFFQNLFVFRRENELSYSPRWNLLQSTLFSIHASKLLNVSLVSYFSRLGNNMTNRTRVYVRYSSHTSSRVPLDYTRHSRMIFNEFNLENNISMVSIAQWLGSCHQTRSISRKNPRSNVLIASSHEKYSGNRCSRVCLSTFVCYGGELQFRKRKKRVVHAINGMHLKLTSSVFYNFQLSISGFYVCMARIN